MQIVRRNDKNGDRIDDSIKITKSNCPELQEILDEIYTRSETFSTKIKIA